MIKYLIALREVNEESSLDGPTSFSIVLYSVDANVLEVRGLFEVVADGKSHKFKDPIDTIMVDNGDSWPSEPLI